VRNIAIIARRELRSYFDSPVAYIVIVAFLLLAGWMVFSPLFLAGRADMRTFFAPSMFSPSMLLVILAPAVTMRLIAEERKSGTIELLTTMPVTDAEVILGKFVAAAGLLCAALALTFLYAVTIAFLGDLDWGMVFGGYLGLVMFAASLCALGLLCSTWTENQIVAFIISFALCAVLYFVYWLQFFLPASLARVFEFASVSFHLDNLARGVVDSRDVIYYVTLTGGALFLAERSLARQHA
jgi:ABC-2 type transport system permease protein